MKHKVIKAEMMGPWKAAAAAYLAVFIFIPERSGEIGARAGTGLGQFIWNLCRLPRYLTKPRQRRSEWDMAGSDGISRVSTVFRGKSLLTNKMRII